MVGFEIEVEANPFQRTKPRCHDGVGAFRLGTMTSEACVTLVTLTNEFRAKHKKMNEDKRR